MFGIFLLLCTCASEPGTIGAALGKQADGRMFVRTTPPGQGAAEAGLLIDDEIVAIDGKDVKGMSEEDVRRAVRGDLGSSMVLTIVREGVHQLLAVAPDVEIVAAVADQLSLRQVCEDEEPDVVLTDIRMPPSHTDEGIRLAAELRESHPEIGVVILSQFSDPTYALALLEQGSDGRAYLLKERVHNRAELMAAIRAVVEGGSMIDPKVVESLVVARGRAKRSPLNELTSRELQVLGEIAQGKSNTAIADSLFLTKRAVEKHINAIFWKLGLAESADVSKRVKAALMFLADEAATPVS